MIIILSLFLMLLLFYIIFLLNIAKGIKISSQSKYSKNNKEFISIIIPFRNESENILNSLESVTNQTIDNSRYEIIYIDDNSEDSTFELLNNFEKPKNVRVLKSPFQSSERAHKKLALKFAIEKSNGELIITTDADCIHNNKWLENIVNSFDDNTAFVSGPVEFLSNGSLYQELQKIEFSSLILVGAGLIGIKKPIICNAANLGFRKSVFNEVGGYEDNLNISSGDDEFLMQKISHTTNYKINFCFEKEAISYTIPNSSLKQFYHQRKRWASKGLHYFQTKIVLTLIMIFLFYLSIPIQMFLGLVVDNIFFVTLLLSIILKFVCEYYIVFHCSKTLYEKPIFRNFLIAELFHIPYIIIAGISGLNGNYKWKGRNIKR